MNDFLVTIVETAYPIIDFFGIVVIILGVLRGLYDLLKIVHSSLQGQKVRIDGFLDNIMKSMIIGLDFFLAGDLIYTVVVPSTEKLVTLGGIVFIRIVLEFFIMHVRRTHLINPIAKADKKKKA